MLNFVFPFGKFPHRVNELYSEHCPKREKFAEGDLKRS
jgi:hypothetical protein